MSKEDLIAERRKPLDIALLSKVEAIFENGSPDDKVIFKFNIEIQQKDLVRLIPPEWLNDQLINFYMEMLAVRDDDLCQKFTGRKKSLFIPTQFMGKMMPTKDKYEPDEVARWLQKSDIFSMNKLYLPINVTNTHWVLAVVYMERKEIHFLDSLRGNGKKYMEGILQWIEGRAGGTSNFNSAEWKLKSIDNNSRQFNGYDCAMFVLLYADFLSDDLPITSSSFIEADIPFFRQKLACDILRGSLSYELNTLAVQNNSSSLMSWLTQNK